MTNYEQSNSITIIPNVNLSIGTKNLYKKLREKTELTTDLLQMLSDCICIDLGIVAVPVKFQGKQPSSNDGKRLTKKVMGKYNTIGAIQIYKYTAVKQKQVAPKTAINTLLHELNHHVDYTIIRLVNSIHSSGFYARLQHLQTLLA
jgi:hypothetical protein